jgi:diguanylate cyclase (GGDEF)-like protein
MKPNRLVDWLLSNDPALRARLVQVSLGMGAMLAGVASMHYFAAMGLMSVRGLWAWTACAVAAIVLAWALVRSGRTARLPDPTLAVPQMVVALTLGAWLYAMLGPARGAAFPVVMVMLMFGLFAATPRQMAVVGLYAVAVFGATMALMAWRQPQRYPVAVELGHFLVVATMMPAAAVLAARVSTLRERMRAQRAELERALERIEELATHDALTGTVNRRHMASLLEGERQRSVRSGYVFCLAVLDVDRLRDVNDAQGARAGDALLRAMAQEAQSGLRLSDRIGRWGGGCFVLMMSDTRAALARGAVERLRARMAQARPSQWGGEILPTVSAGLTEHRAGEPVDKTLARAESALREAKAGGRDRLVVS